ncbi:MAG: helix-turn-helix domain-containing protein [Firmicutes bacterium]|jgi:NitT/TauT family transport system substrate-binding protein|uniref:Helix-turn-helix domain-containing protein n=1 Tax=Sulfobacillus benefaciens TaxID=453960 RepID=A0A2T2XA45_9FIRM|nr:helix-turn-helix domain-containing protein [Bacillota bacterium]MCL5015364.1 helix-turn-helix domain-containing protein [Bacillota bacterium]PSR31317.1 MAG: hypothetical protein C7B43_02815 [Sulfobacillus benefaciens]HBQ94819.1 hypothetical protein [Sulfobacillus sp.]
MDGGNSVEGSKELLTIPEVLSRLHISRSTFDRWRHHRQLPYYKIGRDIFVHQEELRDWVLRQRHGQHEVTPVVIGIQTHTAQTWSGLIIKELRLLETELSAIRKDSVSVIWENADSGLDLLEGMIQGRVHLAYLGDYPIAVGYKLSTLLHRFRLVLLAFDGKSEGGRGIAVLTRSNSKPFESRNLTVVTVPRSSAEHRLNRFVKDMGVSNIQVNYCTMSDGMHLITRQTLVAGCMWEPFPTLMQHLGTGQVIWEESRGQDYLTGLVTSHEWMTNNSSLIYAYLKAQLRAHDLMRTNPERMARVLSKSLGLPSQVIYQILTKTRWDAGIYSRDLQTLNMIGHSMFDEKNMEGIVVMDYLAEAARDMGLQDPRKACLDDWTSRELY